MANAMIGPTPWFVYPENASNYRVYEAPEIMVTEGNSTYGCSTYFIIPFVLTPFIHRRRMSALL